jgi:hypothetical protein
MTPLILVAAVAFVLHLSWETWHVRFYTDYEKMKGRLPVTVFATFADVAYTFLAIVLVSFFKESVLWFLSADISDYIGLALLGFYIAVFVEYKASALEKWKYASTMPLAFGLGVTPLVQMTVLLPLSVYISVALTEWL